MNLFDMFFEFFTRDMILFLGGVFIGFLIFCIALSVDDYLSKKRR